MKYKRLMNQMQQSKSRSSRGRGEVRGFFYSPMAQASSSSWRSLLVMALFAIGFLLVLGQAFYHQVYNHDFLHAEGVKRHEVNVTLPANRGRIEDRNGMFLATSVPVRAVWMIPKELNAATPDQMATLSSALGISEQAIRERMQAHAKKTFVYLKRQVPMSVAEPLRAKKIPGIYFQPEVMRSYPQGALTAHLVGFTNIENEGIEGIEKFYDDRLTGTDGVRTVMRDRLGQVIQNLSGHVPATDGENVRLTIDSQIQYLTYHAVEKAVKAHAAEAGGAIVVDTLTGEILSMVSYPSYDPNIRSARKGAVLRNRVITDVFEPGSIIKPLVAALALDARAIGLDTMFATGSGSWRYHGQTITDVSRYNGTLNVAGILRRSSNIGMAMISDRLRADQMWAVFDALGFGKSPDIGFPGTATGSLRPWERWRPIEKATMSYGYGVSTSLLQMAQAYTALARDGDMIELSLVRDNSVPRRMQVFSRETAANIRTMLEAAAGPQGSKIQAKVNGYSVGGKSGTVRNIVNGSYSRNEHRGSFVAMAPMSQPRIVVALTIDTPRKGGYYGTLVAGPATAEIIEGTLRHLSVPPDLAPMGPTLEAINTQRRHTANNDNRG